MRGPLDPHTQWLPFTKESAANAALTVTLTPDTGHHAVLRKLSVTFDDAISSDPKALEIKINAVSKWKDYIYVNLLNSTDVAIGMLPHVLDFDPGFGSGVDGEAITIHVDAAGVGIKSRVSGIMCDGVTQT